MNLPNTPYQVSTAWYSHCDDWCLCIDLTSPIFEAREQEPHIIEPSAEQEPHIIEPSAEQECGICFSEQQRFPSILPCGHTVCYRGNAYLVPENYVDPNPEIHNLVQI
jgi:hypothetical protein